MANIDTVYLEQLVRRFRAYNSPNDTQRLIILLGSKSERTDEENKNLAVLIKAEKAAEKLVKARAATNKIINAEKTAARKLDVRKKIIWGSALKTASINDAHIADVMRKLWNDGFVSEADKDVVRADFDALITYQRDEYDR